MVPDTYMTMIRVLLFIYTGNVADNNGSDPDNENGDEEDVLLEDLLAADRYSLYEMKRVVESMVVVRVENAASVLDVATVINAPRLKREALALLSRELGRCTSMEGGKESMEALRTRHPGLMSEILELKREAASTTETAADVERLVVECGEMVGRATKHVDERKIRRERKRKERDRKAMEDDLIGDVTSPFPWYLLVVLAGIVFGWSTINRIMVVGPIVPIFNTLFFIAVGGIAYVRLK